MEIFVSKDAQSLGEHAAVYVAAILRSAVASQGSARIVLSTGASQLTTLEALVREDVDWSKIDMFHLDEYVGMSETHKASFRKYLKERFVDVVHPKAAYFVNGNPEEIPALTRELRREPVDVGLIGIGENAHVAFNDPPADFETREAYITVTLNEACRNQQVHEGWFDRFDDVPEQAISMTAYQIMQCRSIVSCVPYACKASAIEKTLYHDFTPDIPATILKEHERFALFVDRESFGLVDRDKIIAAKRDPGYQLTCIE